VKWLNIITLTRKDTILGAEHPVYSVPDFLKQVADETEEDERIQFQHYKKKT
jgi:hypothetical protein